MTILDQQFELQPEPETGSFFDPNTSDSTGRIVIPETDLIQFADTERLCASVLDTARCLSNKGLPHIFRAMELGSLTTKLKELEEEIMCSKFVSISFPVRRTRHTNAYTALLERFGVDSEMDDTYLVMIPRQDIRSVIAHTGMESDSSYQPNIWLRVATGLENKVLTFGDSIDPQEVAHARWFNFRIEEARMKTFGIQD